MHATKHDQHTQTINGNTNTRSLTRKCDLHNMHAPTPSTHTQQLLPDVASFSPHECVLPASKCLVALSIDAGHGRSFTSFTEACSPFPIVRPRLRVRACTCAGVTHHGVFCWGMRLSWRPANERFSLGRVLQQAPLLFDDQQLHFVTECFPSVQPGVRDDLVEMRNIIFLQRGLCNSSGCL